MVDWSKPLEAVHTNGEVKAVISYYDDGSAIMPFCLQFDDRRLWASADGSVPATDWTIRNVASTRENASFYMFKTSGKWAYSGRGHLSEHVFKVFSNVDMRAQILNDNNEQMPGINSNGDGYNVVVIGDESLPYGWPLHLNALGERK